MLKTIDYDTFLLSFLKILDLCDLKLICFHYGVDFILQTNDILILNLQLILKLVTFEILIKNTPFIDNLKSFFYLFVDVKLVFESIEELVSVDQVDVLCFLILMLLYEICNEPSNNIILNTFERYLIIKINDLFAEKSAYGSVIKLIASQMFLNWSQFVKILLLH